MFLNELENNDKKAEALKNLKQPYEDSDNIILFPEYAVKTENMPKELRENGFQIHRKFRFVSVSYDENLERCITKDIRTNANFDLAEFSGGASYGKSIDMTDLVLIMKKQDYNLAKETSDKIMSLPCSDREACINKLSSKELSLAHLYFINIDVEARSKGYYFAHEAHHGISNLKIEQAGLKPNPTGYYKSCEDSEKSAYFSEVLKVIEAYHKSGDYDSFKSFPGTRYNWLKDELKKLSVEKRSEKVGDMEFLINSSNKNWEDNNDFYKKEGSQFEAKTKDYVIQNPTCYNGKDEDYLACKEIYYTFDVYNPKTESYEQRKLASVIKDDVVIGDRGKEFLKPYSKADNKEEIPNLQEKQKNKLSIKDIFNFKILQKRGSK